MILASLEGNAQAASPGGRPSPAPRFALSDNPAGPILLHARAQVHIIPAFLEVDLDEDGSISVAPPLAGTASAPAAIPGAAATASSGDPGVGDGSPASSLRASMARAMRSLLRPLPPAGERTETRVASKTQLASATERPHRQSTLVSASVWSHVFDIGYFSASLNA